MIHLAYDLDFFEWEVIALSMLGDAVMANEGQLSEAAWDERWRVLSGGTILCHAMVQYMNAGTLSTSDKGAVIARISKGSGEGRELAGNLLQRLCGAVSRGRVTLEAAKLTARSASFR